MSSIVTVKPIELPGLENFRIKHVEMSTPVNNYASLVTLQQKVFGPFWKVVDTRFNGDIAYLDASTKRRWKQDAEQELLEDWFQTEINALKA